MNNFDLKKQRIWLPILLWVLFVTTMLIVFQTGATKYDVLNRTLIQWDGQHYLSIARYGYEAFPCSFNYSYVCGNIGWFPFYPILGSVIGALGLEHKWGMLVISWLALLFAMFLLYRLVEKRFNPAAATITLVALLVFPGSFYYLTAFPYSIYLMLALLAFSALDSEKYTLLPLYSGLLAVTYPSGLVIGLPILWILIRDFKKLPIRKRTLLAGSLVSMAATLVAYCTYYWWRFDDFFLYLRIQSQSYYAHEPAFPFVTIYNSLNTLPFEHPIFLTLILVITTAALFFRRRIPIEWHLYAWGILLFTPTMGTCDCYYRHIIVAFPLFVMVGISATEKWGRWMAVTWVIASLIVGFSYLIPAYKLGQLM